MFEVERLETALETLGELLEERGHHLGLLIVGGSSLLLLGLIERPTADLDIVAYSTGSGYVKAESLPDFLSVAVGEVADALGLPNQWLNPGPASLMDFGLPDGFETRVSIRNYGSLEVHIPDRKDLICLKFYAAVDYGPRSKHFADLNAMKPSKNELLIAARWAQTHDPSPPFKGELTKALKVLGVGEDNGAL